MEFSQESRFLRAWVCDMLAKMELPRRVERRASDRIISWIHDPEKRSDSFDDFVRALAQRMVDEGVPLWRLSSSLRTYQPEVLARNVQWTVGGTLKVTDVSREVFGGEGYLRSPLFVARRDNRSLLISLEGSEPQVYPICAELKEQGGTAYWLHAMPIETGTFVSFATKQPGGFTAEEVEFFEAILPALSLRVELFCTQWGLQSLLHLYLGHNAATRVLAGEFRLGHGAEIDAVIWLCDLRGFTSMTDSNPIARVLENLNLYFSCVVEPIQEQGGEVLKFVGDAVLAVFPIAENSAAEVCARAIEAARTAFRSIRETNATRDDTDALRFGLGLHLGRVAYGNIGTHGRLDFTVIGPAVNEAARIEALCSRLERPFLVSQTFADAAACDQLESLGTHNLKGVAEARAIFTMPCIYSP